MNSPYEQNRRAWDERVRGKKLYAVPAVDADFKNPLAVVDQCGWLGGDVCGKRLLCLAAGGGRHSALFASAGARVTVVDLSPKMLQLDQDVADKRGLKIEVIKASMDRMPMLGDGSFEIVIQPVSTCYVPDVLAVYREVARVMAPSGIYVSQHKQPASLQGDHASLGGGYLLSEPYYRQGPLPAVSKSSLHREAGTAEFLHRWEELIGGLCRSGFVVEDLVEPRHADIRAEPGTPSHRAHYIPPFVKIKARRTGSSPASAGKLWLP